MHTLLKNLDFHLMAAMLWFRYRSSLPAEAIAEAGVKPGNTVLDFGCGSGGFSTRASHVAGKNGRVYALDINPLAATYVARRAKKKGLNNIQTITSGLKTGLADKSVNVVLLYDILHHLTEPGPILAELSRVLKDSGRLSASDHHLTDDQIIAGITTSGYFRFEEKGKRTYSFSKAGR
ncbi:MAG: class I SAM-dependent methyltransferase [Deltaproteobacteria bacterium]|nr:class I SAM-dependent methyltransferase [Candidatus Zymogenaceae bacterium]